MEPNGVVTEYINENELRKKQEDVITIKRLPYRLVHYESPCNMESHIQGK
jgi:hypothetical protein